MSAAPWMPLYVADYLADTAHLSAAEHGAYLLLIMHYWRAGKLPTDERQIARIARMNAREWDRSRDTIAAFFDAEWRHQRIENEIAKSSSKANARASSGSRGGKAKALKNKKPSLANATILPEQNPALALASSSQSQEEDKDKNLHPLQRERGIEEFFEEFWNAYPARDGANPKASARLKFFVAFEAGADPQAIIDGAKCYAEAETKRGNVGTQFIATAGKWLDDQRWLDDYAPSSAPAIETVFVPVDSPIWPAMQARKQSETRRPAPTTTNRETGQTGWYFPKPWVAAQERPA